MNELPKTYTPKSLRTQELPPREKIMWGVGLSNNMVDFGMIAGSVLTLEEIIDFVPPRVDLCGKSYGDNIERDAYIIRFNKDRTETPLYKWDDTNTQWVLL